MDIAEQGGKKLPTPWPVVVIWALTLVAVALALGAQFVAGAGTGMALPLILAFPLALLHGARRYGMRANLVFFAVAWIFSNFFENLSILTGFPFGNYHYTGSPRIFYVPVTIGLIYYGLGYVCWMVANVLLDQADANLDWRKGWQNRLNMFALPIIAGAVMTMWDVSTDHWASTVSHNWIWENGGGLFGVPFSNYLGWWFVTWSFFQAFSLYLAYKQSTVSEPQSVVRRGLELPNVLIYGSLGLQFALFQILGPHVSGTVVDATGQVWNKADMFESVAIIASFTMVPIALLALFKMGRGDLNDD
ncbi:hypothetical protein WSK_3060 [Novosphingobium sp. Rr 2-17]|nr:hypothetical protein WSK_3060 [Novosphingobium sp. Rr 2-17]